MEVKEDKSKIPSAGTYVFIPEFKPQKFIIYNRYLPYAADLHKEIVEQLTDIKKNLSTAVILRDIRPGCSYWVAQLARYIRLYGMCFSKDDHILFIKLLYELVIIPNQEFLATGKFAQVLSILLRKRELLSPEDITLPWKPLYDTYHDLFHSSAKHLGMVLLPSNAECLMKSLIRSCHPYFPLSTTAELLEKGRPHLCPFDQSMNRAISLLEVFIPTLIAPENADQGWKLWLNEFLDIWNTFNDPSWQSALFCLFARLAWHNIGLIDWEKHLSIIFTRILRRFNLPVQYKKVQISCHYSITNWSISWFIVANLGGGSKTQDLLEQLFKVLRSYYHPSNSGSWTKTLQDLLLRLSQNFLQRLHHERHKKPSWMTVTPEWKRLTDDDISRFVKCLLPAAKLAVFSKSGSYDAGTVMHRLSLLCPEIVIPHLLEQLYSSLETTTEPHRLTASLNCVVRVARPLVLGGSRTPDLPKRFPEGPTHALPLLMMALPGIDPNDITKCMSTFQFIATFVYLIPLVDCSSAIEEISDLTQEEQQVCLQTAGFSDFVMQFMDKSFSLIENSSLEQTTQLDRETENMNVEENMIELGLSTVFKVILTQAHPKIFDEALLRLHNFTKGRSMETKVSGKIISTMCRAAAKVNPEKTLKTFIPGVCRLLLTLTEGPEIQEDENLDDEILFNILILSELVNSHGRYLLEYLPILTEVLKRTLHLKCRKANKMASSVLRHLLWSLSLSQSKELRSSTHSWETPFEEFLPIRHWGRAGHIECLDMTWMEPGEEEEKAISALINEFLPPELYILRRITEGDSTVCRERLHQSLIIIQDILFAGLALPLWDEEPLTLMDMSVGRASADIKLSTRPLNASLNSKDFSSNVRFAIANATLSLVDVLLQNGSDDTKALNYIITIYTSLIFFHGAKIEEYEQVLKNFHRLKYSLADSVLRNKQHIRVLLLERVLLQHGQRVLLKGLSDFTPTHQKILSSLWNLSISQYSEVRRKSQGALNKVIQQFTLSYKLLLPDITKVLQKDAQIFHKEIKGALFVVLSFKKKSLVIRRDWQTLSMLWPTLLSTQYSEKPSVIKLFEAVERTLMHYFELFAIKLQVPEKAVENAKLLLQSRGPCVPQNEGVPSLEEEAEMRLLRRNQENIDLYNSLVKKIAKLIDGGTLHWRRVALGLTMLWYLVRIDVPYPVHGVQTLIMFLINENITLRKIALNAMACIFKNQKRPHEKKKFIPSKHEMIKPFHSGDDRSDKRLMQYNRESINQSEEDWEKSVVIHKTYIGWYAWPKEMDIYLPPKNQPPLDRPYVLLSPEEKAVYDFFNSEEHISKLISFLSLEEVKGMDKFDQKVFFLFKGLFRNFGDAFLPLFEVHLKRLASDPTESSQRCAAELIAGMVRGSKHWPYEKCQKLMTLTCGLVEIVFSKVMNETLYDWGAAFSNISRDRDSNRLAPLIELFLDKLTTQEEGSFLFSSRLYLSRIFLEQQEWRIADCLHRLYETLKPHLASPYKNIRDHVGALLYVTFSHDQNLPGGANAIHPRVSTFVDQLYPRLSVLIQESGSGGVACEITSSYQTPHSSDSLPPLLAAAADPSLAVEVSSAAVAVAAVQVFDQSSRPESPKEELQTLSLSSSVPLAEEHAAAKGLLTSRASLPLDENLSLLPLYQPSDIKIQLGNVQSSLSGNGFLPGESEERKAALRLLNTVCKYLKHVSSYGIFKIPTELYKFLPHLCQLESINSDQELRNNCIISIACLSCAFIPPETISFVFQILQSICQNGWWRAKSAALGVLQVMIFNNMFTVIEQGVIDTVRDIVLNAVADARAEVRQMASKVLSGLFHCSLLMPNSTLLDKFISQLNSGRRRRRKSTGRLEPLSSHDITIRHSGALGLCAYVNSHPYDVPPEMPPVLVVLTEHTADPQPVSNDIKECLRNFQRTHHDNWQEQKKMFSSDQLTALTDVLVSPSYYA